MWTILLIVAVVVIVVAILAWSFVFKKADLSVSGQKVAFEIIAPDLLKAFEAKEDSANKKFNGKVISVTGTVAEVKEDPQNISVYLKEKEATSGVMCSFDKSAVKSQDFKVGQQIRLKGICTGYLMDVLLNKCALEK
jgi:hypothetical protein